MQTPAAFRRGSLKSSGRRNSLRDLMEGNNNHNNRKALTSGAAAGAVGTSTDQLLVGKGALQHEDSQRTLSTRTTSTISSHNSSCSSVSTTSSHCSSVGSISIRSQQSTSYKKQQQQGTALQLLQEQQQQQESSSEQQQQQSSLRQILPSAAKSPPLRSVMASNNNHKKQQRNNNNKKKTNNHIRFPEPAGQVVGNVSCLAEITAEERWETWWCPQEYQAIRLAAKYSTKQIRKCDKSSADSVDAAFKSALHLANLPSEEEETEQSASEDDDDSSGDEEQQQQQAKKKSKSSKKNKTTGGGKIDLYQAALQDPSSCSPQHVVTLEQWCTSKLPTRGLEKYVGAAHKAERQQNLQDSKKVVVELCQKQPRCSTEIALTYQEYCRYAVLFARLTAHGDECAAKKAQSSSNTSPLKDGMDRSGARRTGRRRNSIASTDSSGDESMASTDSNDSNRLTHLQRSFSKRKLLAREASLKKKNLEGGGEEQQQQQGRGGGGMQRSGSRRALMMQQQQQEHDSKRNLYKQDSKRGLMAKQGSRRGLLARRHSNDGTTSTTAASATSNSNAPPVLFAPEGRRGSLGGTATGNGGLTRQRSARGLMTRQRSGRGLRRHHSTDGTSMAELQRQQQQQQAPPQAGFLMMTPPPSTTTTSTTSVTSPHDAADAAIRARRDSLVGVTRRDSLDLTCTTTMRSTRRKQRRPQRPEDEAAAAAANNGAEDPLLSGAAPRASSSS